MSTVIDILNDDGSLSLYRKLSARLPTFIARYGPEIAAKIVPLVSHAFTDGLRLAYCLALAFAVLGLIFSLRLDESQLRGVDKEAEPR